MPVSEGDVLGNYRVLSCIGVGGMGTVYLAEHPLIGKRVALKVIHQELASNAEIVARFFNEARAVNKIGNDHIVEIHDFGQTPSGESYFLMEYLEGRTLAEVIDREGALATHRVLHIAAQIASGLGAAHARSIVHRDLKPDNIMLMSRLGDPDFVKVLDFGLAKMFAEAGTVKTKQGVVLGTPQYMAPESCESAKTIDHRADIYSLGILMFQMATGRLPFDGGTMGEILVQHVTQPPPAPRGINPAIPPAVEQIILRCLAKTPEARFLTMEQLRVALIDPDRYLAGSPPIVPSASVPMAAQGRTVLAEASTDPAFPPGPYIESSGLTALPDLEPPVLPKNRTMRIGGPVRSRRRWPAVVTVLTIVALAGAVTALALSGSGESSGPADGDTGATGTGDAGSGSALAGDPGGAEPSDGAPGDAGPDGPPGGESDVATATIQLRTEPPGAQVFDASDTLLGTTPTSITLPRDGLEHTLIFRHPDRKDREKTIVVTGDAEYELELERIRERRSPRRDRSRKDRRKRKRRGGELISP